MEQKKGPAEVCSMHQKIWVLRGKKSKEILLALNEMSYLEGRWDKKDMKSNQSDFKLAIMK